MQSPLLAGDDANRTLSLSSDPVVTEESEFSRLIAQNSPLEVLGEQHYHLEEGGQRERQDNSIDYALLEPYGFTQDSVQSLSVSPPRGPVTTAVAGALCLFHLAFVWSSYTSDVWAESRVRVSVAWQEQYLPLLNDAKETVIHSTTLTSLLKDLDSSRNYVLMFTIWSVSLLLPCCFVILGPTFILADHKKPIVFAHRSRFNNGRGLLETSMRWALMTFFVVILLNMSTSFMELQWTDTKIEVGNRTRGGLAAYVTGIMSAIGLAVLLRSPASKLNMFVAPPNISESMQNDYVVIRPPPPQAFQDPWRPTMEEDDDEPTMTVLEETPITGQRTEAGVSMPSTPELVPEQDGGVQVAEQTQVPFWCKFLSFQLGLVSLLLWIPIFYLPSIQLNISGLATNFLANPTLKLFIWEIGGTLWKQGFQFGTPVWVILVTELVLILTTLVLPFLATCLGVLAWLADGKMSTQSYAWLFAIHPAIGGLVFSVSLIAVVYSVTPFGMSILDNETSGFCSRFKDITGEVCLIVQAKILPGAWFYLVQSLALEIFVWATLRWGSSKTQ